MDKRALHPWSLEERGRILLAVASHKEAGAVLAGLGQRPAKQIPRWEIIPIRDRFDVVVTGVGKANAAGATAKVCQPARHGAVVNVGVAGALPGSDLWLGSVVLASQSVYGDEGVITPTGFEDLASMGFGPIATGEGISVAATEELLKALEPLADRVGPIATVSTCSGTDGCASEMVRRTGAIAEAMEGAAVGAVVVRLNALSPSEPIAFAEIRAVSNTTGNRDRQRWSLPKALDRLRRIASSL